MKNINLRALLLVFAFAVTFAFKSSAQDEGWKKMTWKEYNIDFFAPVDFTVTKNDATAYTANGSIFTMSIKPWKDASITEPLPIAQQAWDVTPGTDKSVIKETPLNVNGLEGYYAYGVAFQNGKGMHMIIAGFLDPNSSTNFTVQLLFWDKDDAENDLNYNAAQYILNSFKPIN